jgi:hypothetical protein
MADSNIPIPMGFQKGGNVSRSPLKNINNRAMELERLRRVLETLPYEPMSLLNDTHRLFIKEMAVHLDLDGEKLIEEIALYIDGILQEEQTPYTAERVLSIVSAKLRELEDDAEAERLNDLRKMQKQRTMCPNLVPAPARNWSRNSREERQIKMLVLPPWSRGWSREAPQDFMEVLELLQKPTEDD